MIEKCNFKECSEVGMLNKTKVEHCNLMYYAEFVRHKCVGEDNCVIYQTYKLLQDNKK